MIWKNQQDDIQVMFRNLYIEKSHADITLVCDDQVEVEAHKIVLVACSPFFRRVIQATEQSLIYLDGFTRNEMESMLEFMYLGEAEIAEERLEGTLKMFKDLEIRDDEDIVSVENELKEESHEKNISEDEEIAIKSSTHITNDESEELDGEDDGGDDGVEGNTDRGENQEKISDPVNTGNGLACPHCPKLFRRGYNRKVHIERVHNKSRPWSCQFCQKTFATRSDLRQHLASHGLGKTLKCEQCGREFNNRDSASLHRKQHSNQRTHFCQDCGKAFFKSSCLQVTKHQKILIHVKV